MVRIVVTGGAGFVGARLARELLKAGTLSAAGAPPQPLSTVTLIDRVPVPDDLAADDRVTAIRSEITEVTPEMLAGADVIFHLAAAVSGESEADFDLGLSANLRGTEVVLAACRTLGTAPVVVFTSSYAVFGGSAEHPMPPVIVDQTPPNPQTSYGTQKAMLELLLADYTRKGFLHGRAMRLATVSVRAGPPQHGRVQLPVRHHQGTAGGSPLGRPCPAGDGGRARLPRQGRRRTDPRGHRHRRGVG